MVNAARTRVAQEPVSGGPYFDADGNVLDGSGITLGVIDGGLQGLHPDFGNILANYRIVGPDLVGAGFPEYVDVGPTSSEAPGGGHGTHVAGIVAGQGLQSDGGYPVPEVAPYIQGTFTGVAPQAQLHAATFCRSEHDLTVTTTDARFPGVEGRFRCPHPDQRQERRTTRRMSYCRPPASNERGAGGRVPRGGLARELVNREN